jgi:hypothetical protein
MLRQVSCGGTAHQHTMNTSRHTIRIWGILSVAPFAVTMLSSALATIMLEALLAGREPASINTRLPGWTYASATVMKICLVAGVVAAVIALVNIAWRRWFPVPGPTTTAASDDRQERTTNSVNISAKVIPIWGILSVALPPLAPLIGALVVLIAQALVDRPEGASMSYLSLLSRSGVLVMLAWITASLVLGVLALLKRERPWSLSIFGLITNTCIVGLYWYFEFYKLGFDQDRWAAP